MMISNIFDKIKIVRTFKSGAWYKTQKRGWIRQLDPMIKSGDVVECGNCSNRRRAEGMLIGSPPWTTNPWCPHCGKNNKLIKIQER